MGHWTSNRSGTARTHAGQPAARRSGVAYFQYIGATGLSVTGAVTGAPYRFGAPGAIVAVDLADRPGLAAVPHLRQVDASLVYADAGGRQ